MTERLTEAEIEQLCRAISRSGHSFVEDLLVALRQVREERDAEKRDREEAEDGLQLIVDLCNKAGVPDWYTGPHDAVARIIEQRDAAREQTRELREALDCVAAQEDCRQDSSGYCHTHAAGQIQNGECPHWVAGRLLENPASAGAALLKRLEAANRMANLLVRYHQYYTRYYSIDRRETDEMNATDTLHRAVEAATAYRAAGGEGNRDDR